MAARIFIKMTDRDFRAIAEELTRFAEKAHLCADAISSEGRFHETDGMKNTIDGLDSLAVVLQGVIGKFAVPLADLHEIRASIEGARLERDARKKEIEAKSISDLADIRKEPKKTTQSNRNARSLPRKPKKRPHS